ncbi:MAG: CotH kinase family protein [Bacteroidota bacterium]
MSKHILLSCSFLLLGITLFAQEKSTYAIDNFLEVRLTFEQDNWHEVLDSLKQAGEEKRLKGDVTINGKKYEGIGVRYKGNSSYNSVRKFSDKLPFNIKLDFDEKKHKLPDGFETLKLSNVFRDPSFLREVLSYEIANKYMHAPRANFAKLYVNDQYLGLYNNTESVDKKFLKENFGDKGGTLVKCDPNWKAKASSTCPKGEKSSLMYLGKDSLCYMPYYEMKTDYGWQDVIELATKLHYEPGRVEEIIDINEVLWMLAFNNVLVNLDSYTGQFCHNYYLYRDEAGLFHPVVWDMNLCFGGFRYTGITKPLSNTAMQKMSPLLHYKQKNEKRPLITQLLKIDLYQKMYIAHMRTILEENFMDSTFVNRAKEVQTIIKEAVESDENKLYNYEGFEQNLYASSKAGKSSIIGIMELMNGRAAYLSKHPLISRAAPVISEVKPDDLGSAIVVNSKIEGTERAWLMYRYGTSGRFSRMEMMDDGGHNDIDEADGIYGATVEERVEGAIFQYYIIAEGDKSATLSPRRAGKELHTVEAGS